MVRWADFECANGELAERGRRLLYQGPIAYGFLGTVRQHDGGPRLHPVCPVIAGGGLYVFVVEMSPKYGDLLADPRYALHSFPLPEGGEEFYVTGEAWPEGDTTVRERVVAATGGALGGHEFERLFELSVERVLHTKWENWGTPQTWPSYERWRPA
ncbi:MAG: hypothetical protein ACM3S1_05535 [Hyphomicrobiales bacterium]